MLPLVTVVAAVIERDGRVLVTRRPPGVHLEGHWEFPGGKVHDGEDEAEALIREIREELDCAVKVGDEVFATTHAYPDRRVALRFRRCALEDEPRPQLGQDMRWVERSELRTLTFPPADEELIERLMSGRVP